MALEYVKHNREVTAEQLQKYGKFATHDIHVPVLLMYELGKIKDSNGTDVNVDIDQIKATQKATNSWVKKRYDSPFARLKAIFQKPIDQVEIISIIKNHDVKNVDNTVGHLRGLLRIEQIEGIAALIGDAVIKDPEAKQSISGDLLRNTSVGIRPDNSLRELSFVVNEAIPHGGLLMGEHGTVENPAPSLENLDSPARDIQLAEFAELQLSERELEDIIIPNHITLTRLIKTGKIAPWQYDKLIKTRNQEALQFMESTLPSVDLCIMYGTQREVEKVNTSDMLIDTIAKKYHASTDKTSKDIKDTKTTKKVEPTPKQIEIIKQVHSFEEHRAKELTHILELAEHSPQILLKYLKLELGQPQSVEDCASKDIQLSEYISQSKEIKNKLKQLTIELGEHNV